jgi:hypothetical protein
MCVLEGVCVVVGVVVGACMVVGVGVHKCVARGGGGDLFDINQALRLIWWWWFWVVDRTARKLPAAVVPRTHPPANLDPIYKRVEERERGERKEWKRSEESEREWKRVEERRREWKSKEEKY